MGSKMMRQSMRTAFATIAFSILAITALYAQDYPAKTIRIVVPFAAGGGVDVVARTMAKHLAEQLRQQVYVENRPGASGNLGAENVVQSAPDGYTLLISASTLVVNPIVSAERASFDPMKDLAHLGLIAKGPLLFIVHPAVATNLQEFVSKARANPEKVNLGTGGYGSAGHMSAEAFKLRADLKIPVVLFRGTAPAFNDLLGGHISGLLDPLVTSLPLAQGKKVTALAISDAKRSPLALDVPTFAEAGFPGFEFYTWYGLWSPANLPANVVGLVEQALKEIGAMPDVQQWFAQQGLEFSGIGGQAFRDFSRSEQVLYEDIVRRGNIMKK
jgi:tripartite-type tricarboxylate transporter receptor subunit TctC